MSQFITYNRLVFTIIFTQYSQLLIFTRKHIEGSSENILNKSLSAKILSLGEFTKLKGIDLIGNNHGFYFHELSIFSSVIVTIATVTIYTTCFYFYFAHTRQPNKYAL